MDEKKNTKVDYLYYAGNCLIRIRLGKILGSGSFEREDRGTGQEEKDAEATVCPRNNDPSNVVT